MPVALAAGAIAVLAAVVTFVFTASAIDDRIIRRQQKGLGR